MGLTVSVAQAAGDEVVLPKRVQEALGELIGTRTRDYSHCLSVEIGLGAQLRERLEREVEELVGER